MKAPTAVNLGEKCAAPAVGGKRARFITGEYKSRESAEMQIERVGARC